MTPGVAQLSHHRSAAFQAEERSEEASEHTLLTWMAKSIRPLILSEYSIKSNMNCTCCTRGRWYDIPKAKLVICSKTLRDTCKCKTTTVLSPLGPSAGPSSFPSRKLLSVTQRDQPAPGLEKVSYLRCDLVLIKVRKVLELCKDIFSCWECFWFALFPLLAFLSTYQSWENHKTVLSYLPHQKGTRPQTSAPASPSEWPAPVMQHRQKAQVPDLKLIRTVLNSKQ